MQQVLTDPASITLMRIQHVIAVEFGFLKWEELIGTSAVELQSLIAKKKISNSHLNERSRRTTPLGNFFRGPGIIPTSPLFAAWADFFDSMTMEEQRRYLDEDARTRRLI